MPTGPKIRIGPVEVESMVAYWMWHATTESNQLDSVDTPSEGGGGPNGERRPGVLGRLRSWWRETQREE